MIAITNPVHAMPVTEHAPANIEAWAGYTCPMHPEVRQDNMGRCPQCGMALEPIRANPDRQEEDPDLLSNALRLRNVSLQNA
jgi:P-type Cu+ transporter